MPAGGSMILELIAFLDSRNGFRWWLRPQTQGGKDQKIKEVSFCYCKSVRATRNPKLLLRKSVVFQ